MSAISQDLAMIDSAKYGEEVRGSIHHAIEQCYTDVSSGVTIAETAASSANSATTAANGAADRANAAAAGAENMTGLVAPTWVDNSSLANVGDPYVHNGALYWCITPITTGEVWTAAHWSTRPVGNVAADLKSALNDLSNYNRVNLISLFSQKNSTYKGITYDWLNHICRVYGTSTATSYYDIFDISTFDVFKKGSTYYVIGATGSIHIRVYAKVDNEITELINATGKSSFTIPSNATRLFARLWISSNNTVDMTITPIIISKDWYINKGLLDGKYTDANDIFDKDVSIYYFNSNLANCPSGITSGWIVTTAWPYPIIEPSTSSNMLQICVPLEGYGIKKRTRIGGTWRDWTDSGLSYITEVSRDTYNNTYNITTSPTITTDSNGWLQPIDTDTADETGKTDMTGAIMSMLTNTGYCHLAPGIYYVSGGIDMPDGSMIEGCGDQTIIRLLQSVTSGYIIRMTTRCTVKNVHLSGAKSALNTESSVIGGRTGISFTGTESNKLCMIDGCWFKNLDNGVYGYNGGGGIQEGLIISNCYFHCCKAGINFDRKVEYSKVTNCVTYKCHYGCINNGGNNVFTACTFHGIIGLLIDNSGDDKPNPAHGSCIGCTFNHIANDIYSETLGGGPAVKIINLTSGGFIFTGCQFWYGNIDIQTGYGIVFSGCLFGGGYQTSVTGSPKLSVTGIYPVFFKDCLFKTSPIKNLNSSTKMDKCYLMEDGSEVTKN